MNKREDALREALQKNEEETQRWKTYLKENETAIENMNMFGKRLTVDVMVPVGKKALMPGYLMHTNEVLVSHYQGYFSKCTSHKAKEICELRIKMAKEHLKKLETEAELWQNKLEKPYAEGVMASGEEREIIEDYNEETEKLWKEKHKLRVKQAKQKEREEREKELQKEKSKKENSSDKEKSDEEIFKMLEEAELMEELEQELDKLEVEEVNDETIRKLMSGEMKLPPEKKRLAHEPKIKDNLAKGETSDESSLRQNIVKKNDLKTTTNQINTNNNVNPNPEITNMVNSQENAEPEDDEEPLPEEVALIKEQAKFLSAEDQIGFYDYQIQIIRQKLQLLPLKTQKELDEKIRLLSVLEHLEELLETAEETVGAEELAEKDTDIEETESKDKEENLESKEKTDVEKTDTTKTNQKRRISFALEDQTLEFRKHEAVTQMLPPKQEKPPQRDIIKLEDDNEEEHKENKTDNKDSTQNSPLSKKDLIQAKVEKNLQFVAEHQSKQDFDLVNQILQSSMGEIHTLQIKFKHSPREGYIKDNKDSSDIPASPADFYDLYIKTQKELKNEQEPSTLFINSYEGEDQVRAPVLKESDRQLAFKDPKAEFSNPSKSILKNKSAVDKENHYTEQNNNNSSNKNKKSKKKSNKKEEDECLSAYYKVMNDVVEKPLTEPEPLPDVKFIDAHAPKKRISRFKQMRKGSETT